MFENLAPIFHTFVIAPKTVTVVVHHLSGHGDGIIARQARLAINSLIAGEQVTTDRTFHASRISVEHTPGLIRDETRFVYEITEVQ